MMNQTIGNVYFPKYFDIIWTHQGIENKSLANYLIMIIVSCIPNWDENVISRQIKSEKMNFFSHLKTASEKLL